MKHVFKKFLSVALLLVVAANAFAASCDTGCDTKCDTGSCGITSCYAPRSGGSDNARKLVGSVGHTHLNDMDSWYGTFAVTVGYQRSFRAKDICSCLFGTPTATATNTGNKCDDKCGACTYTIQGSTVTDRDENAVLADYLYLPTDFDGTISFEPRIQSVLVNFDLYVGLDEWMNNLYFRVYGPVQWSKWDLNFKENVTTAGVADHAAGYFTPDVLANGNLLKSFEAYASGKSPESATQTITAGVQNIAFTPLKFAKILKCDQTDTCFADLRGELGWNFLNEEDYHLGANVQFAAPTCTKKQACVLFGAMSGNGNHWEVGGGLTGHYTFWRSEDQDKSFGFHMDANITHMVKASAQRTFDLKGKPLSRYMLASKMNLTNANFNVRNQAVQAGTAATSLFNNEYAPVANLSTVNVKVSSSIQADVAFMLNYTMGGFGFDLGYNLWVRSCEDIDLDCECPNFALSDGKTWALKGDSHMFGYTTLGTVLEGVPLSATQSAATIFAGSNEGQTTPQLNPGVNNPTAAFGRHENDAGDAAALLAFTGTAINTSIQPVFLKLTDLDLGQRTRGISHKVFGHASYTFDRDNWVPYLGVGVSGEFGSTDDCCPTDSATTTNDDCSKCMNCALSQWSVWVKGGVSFN